MKAKEFAKKLLEHPDTEVFVCEKPVTGCSVGLAYPTAPPVHVNSPTANKFYIFQSCSDLSAHNIPPSAEFTRRSNND